MSTIVYATLTNRSRTTSTGVTGSTSADVSRYVAAMAALVPAEVLAIHAVVMTLATESTGLVTEIIAPGLLKWAFYALLAASIVLYVLPRIIRGSWEPLDAARAAIAPLAFTAWTMLQRPSAFDTVFPSLGDLTRIFVALLLAALLGVVASALSDKTDS